VTALQRSAVVLTAEADAVSTPTRQWRWLIALEVLGVLASPLAVVMVLGAPVMLRDTIIDPSFYKGLMQHGPTLLDWFGSADYFYFWTRVGFTLPGRASFLGFGPVGGFFVFRYVLALILVAPTYLLVRRLHSRTMALLTAPVLLASPVVLTALGTDYVDGAALCYFGGAIACLVMPTTSRRARLLSLVASGVLLSFAVYTHLNTILVIPCLLAAYAVVSWREGVRRLVGMHSSSPVSSS
jgi:Dolichyl-phosphate-mannose-protein mannosyltransferase